MGPFVFSFHRFAKKKRKKKKEKKKAKKRVWTLILTEGEWMDNHDGRVVIALIYGGWIHRLLVEVRGNLSILYWQMVVDQDLARYSFV